MTLEWTTTPPTEPGFYWASRVARRTEKITRSVFDSRARTVIRIDYDGALLAVIGAKRFPPISYFTHFCGPIEPPPPVWLDGEPHPVEGFTLEVTCRHCGATTCLHGNPISICRKARAWYNQHLAEFGEPPVTFTQFVARWLRR